MRNAKPLFYLSFKKKISKAFHLERRIFTQTFLKEDKYQARTQYIVYLVSCFEAFFREVFINSINYGLLNSNRLKKIKKLKKLRFSVGELLSIKDKKIKPSELIAEYMNFQSNKELHEFCFAFEFNKYSQRVKKKLDKLKGADKEDLIKFRQIISRQKKKNLESLKISKTLINFTVSFMGSDEILLHMFSADKCFNTISQMIFLRHKIVHEAKDIKIENWKSWAYTLATVQFANMLSRIYSLKLAEIKSKK